MKHSIKLYYNIKEYGVLETYQREFLDSLLFNTATNIRRLFAYNEYIDEMKQSFVAGVYQSLVRMHTYIKECACNSFITYNICSNALINVLRSFNKVYFKYRNKINRKRLFKKLMSILTSNYKLFNRSSKLVKKMISLSTDNRKIDISYAYNTLCDFFDDGSSDYEYDEEYPF